MFDPNLHGAKSPRTRVHPIQATRRSQIAQRIAHRPKVVTVSPPLPGGFFTMIGSSKDSLTLCLIIDVRPC